MQRRTICKEPEIPIWKCGKRKVLETSTGKQYLHDKAKRDELLKRAGDAVRICMGLIDGDKQNLDYPFTSLVVHNINFEAVIKLMVVGCRMLSEGLYLSLLCPNLFLTRLQIAVSDEFLTARNC